MGSPHDGEALSAARKACQIVQAAGLSWETLLAAKPSPNVQPMQASTQPDGTILHPPVGRTWHATAMFLLPYVTQFITRDVKFVQRMVWELQIGFIAPAEARRLCGLYQSLTPSNDL